MRVKKLIIALFGVWLLLMICCSCERESPSASETTSHPLLSVHYLDVGQGDSIFIELPNRKTVLIDTGENYHGSGILDYIRRCGYERIDYLIGTHPHSDHIGSMAYIVRRFEVGEIYMPEVAANTAMYEELLSCIRRKEITVHPGKAGVTLPGGDNLTLTLLGPVTIDEENLNNSSLILKLEYEKTSFLFLGDAETEELESVTLDMSADVLKVGHHGSRTSTSAELLDRVKPQIAVISVGKDNDYGHPHPETLDFLQQIDCSVYRTDLDGTVTVTSDGARLSVSTGGDSIERAK